MTDLTLYGFSGSTYVRTARMVLAAKGAAYAQVPVDVLAGEPGRPEHLARHPFGKVPVLDHGAVRVIETHAICRYLDEVLPGPALTPDTPQGRARMTTAICLIDSYGYGPLISVAAYHLFPDFVGGKDDAALGRAMAGSAKVLGALMALRGDDPWIAGATPGIADYHLAPLCFYAGLTPDGPALLGLPGMAAWWAAAQALPEFAATPPG